MGIINQGILGGVSGAIGNVVGGSWKGINYLRIKAASYSDAKSEEQVYQRARFAACIAFAKSVLDTLIRPIWDRKAVKMSGFNLFLKKNIDSFDEDGILTGYDTFNLSVGDLPKPGNIVVANAPAGNGAITITWTDNSGVGAALPTDRLKVGAMSNGELTLFQGLAFTRSTGTANVQLPIGTGETAHVYVYFANEGNTMFSPDQHSQLIIS